MSVQSLFFGRWFTTSQQFPVSYIEYSSEEHEKRFSIHHRFQSNNTEDRTAGETERTTFSKLIMFLILCRVGRGGIIGGWRRTKVPRQRHQTSERPIAQRKVDFDDDVDESINDWGVKWTQIVTHFFASSSCCEWQAKVEIGEREREWTKHCRCSIRTIHHE